MGTSLRAMPDTDRPGAGSGPFPPIDLAALWQNWWRAWGGRGPFSGDVSQDIDTSLVRSVGDQLGFININTRGSGDPSLEREITEQVASYGRQLGRVLDAMDVLIRKDERASLAPDEQHALDELTALRDEIEAVKKRGARDRVDRLVADIQLLAGDPDANADALQRLRDALKPPAKPKSPRKPPAAPTS